MLETRSVSLRGHGMIRGVMRGGWKGLLKGVVMRGGC